MEAGDEHDQLSQSVDELKSKFTMQFFLSCRIFRAKAWAMECGRKTEETKRINKRNDKINIVSFANGIVKAK